MSEARTSPPAEALTVIGPADVDRMPWQPLRGLAGVEHKVLWRSGEMVVGLVQLAPGAAEPGHVHHDADHHVHVLRGSATVADRPAPTGSFVYVPAGVAHSTVAGDPEGCTLFYTYVPRH